MFIYLFLECLRRYIRQKVNTLSLTTYLIFSFSFFQPQGKLFQLRQVENTPQLRRVILLTLGTMYRNLYQQQKYLPYSTTPSQEFRTLTNDFVQQIRSLFEKYDRESEVDRRTVLGCIGNSGLPDLYQLLERVISDESNKYPQSVRISAIFATRHMPQQMKRKVRSQGHDIVIQYEDFSKLNPLFISR